MNVTIVDDNVLENVESFNVTLETPGLDMRIALDPVDGVVEIRDGNIYLFSNSSERELHDWILNVLSKSS